MMDRYPKPSIEYDKEGLHVGFLPEYSKSGIIPTAFWTNPLLRRHLDRIFGLHPGEMLTGVCIDPTGIRGNIISSPDARHWESDAEMIKFSRKAKQYKGRQLCFRMTLGETGVPLREQRGKFAMFFARPKGELVKLRAELPADIQVPDAEWSDVVLVEFQCNRGSTYFGNKVISIRIF